MNTKEKKPVRIPCSMEARLTDEALSQVSGGDEEQKRRETELAGNERRALTPGISKEEEERERLK